MKKWIILSFIVTGGMAFMKSSTPEIYNVLHRCLNSRHPKNMEEQAGNKNIYNTTLPGYGNYGHTFGDQLTDQERKAVIEYLKTL